MLLRSTASRRSGSALVEAAFIYPVAFFLVLALIVGAAGIFRYQEVAALAREGARYGSTHGAQYRKDAGLSVGTSSDWTTDIYTNGIAPKMVSLDPSALNYTISWPDVVNQPGKPDNWPGSKVTVTITYTWTPEVLLLKPITFTSTSSMPISN